MAVLATGVVGFINAPMARSKPEEALSVVAVTKMASIAPTLDATPSQRTFDAAVAIVPASAGIGDNWYQHLANPEEDSDSIRGDRLKRVLKQARLAVPKVVAVARRDGAAPDAVRFAAATPARAVATPARLALEAAIRKAAKARAGKDAGHQPATVAAAQEVPLPAPDPKRFIGSAAPAEAAKPIILAYADPSPSAAGGAIDALMSGQNGELLPDTPLAGSDDGLPQDGPLPLARPKFERPDTGKNQDTGKNDDGGKPEIGRAAVAKPDAGDADDAPAAKPKVKDSKVAVAKPDKPVIEEDDGGFLGKLFRGGGSSARTKAGDGVAVYDISAAMVYMPDGSRLEAHSGIGEMADDPRYVHVKMNGPTPPHTYVLKMREKRFHGVEAIRMLPVNGKNLHGRDGFLTHSYLLRGRKAQSHGCVAFKDYEKFLNAFKAGKVKKLVVVTGGGKAVAARVARNGNDI